MLLIIPFDDCCSMYSLTSNRLTSQGTRRLLQAVKHNRSLIELKILPLREKRQSTGIPGTLAELKRVLDRNKDAYASAVNKALDNRATAPLNRSKVMLLGAGASGKTATVRSLLYKPFNPNWDSTIGIDTTQTKAGANGMWEVEGPGAQVDHTSTLLAQMVHESFEEGKVEGVEGAAQPRTDVLARSPSEVLDSSVKMNMSMKMKMKLLEASSNQQRYSKPYNARTKADTLEEKASNVWGMIGSAEIGSIKLSIFDYGGQEVFHTLHTLFLSKYGVYLVVFNTRRYIGNPADTKDSIAYWLSSTSIYAPEAAVIIVGTFLDDLSKDELSAVQNGVKEVVSNTFPSVITQKENDLVLFAVDNKSGNGISLLRTAIQKSAQEQEYVHVHVRLRWMQLLDWLFEAGRAWIALEEVRQRFEALRGEEEGDASEELNGMLALFHQVGLLSYFTGTESLARIVVVHTQWLVDSISKVIRDKDVHPITPEVTALLPFLFLNSNPFI